MRITIYVLLLAMPTSLLCQINTYPANESFEGEFTLGTNINFIPNWMGNEVKSNSRIFQGSSSRSGKTALHIIPTASFSGEVSIALDLSEVNGATISFYAYSKKNGSSSSNRPVLVSLSTSVDGGSTYMETIQIGEDSTFPNNNEGNYALYQYELPDAVSKNPNVVVKLTAQRGPGKGSTAELVLDDFSIEEQIAPLKISNTLASSSTSVLISFNQEVTEESAVVLENYAINQGVTVVSAERITPTEVLLTTTEMVNNTYQLAVKNVKDSSTKTPTNELIRNFSFVMPLSIERISVIDQHSIEIDFNLSLDQASAQTMSNYAVDKGIGTPAQVTHSNTDDSKVTLIFDKNLSDDTYELIVNKVLDKSTLAAAQNLSGSFNYLPLIVHSVLAKSPNELEIIFNQQVEKGTAENESNYFIDYDISSPQKAILSDSNSAIVTLVLEEFLVNNTYSLSITNVQNLSGNAVASSLEARLKFDVATNPREIVINEIYADPNGESAPSPQVLPNNTTSEFIELLNTSSKAIEITDFDLSGGRIESFVLEPKGHVILTASSNLSTYETYGPSVGVKSWNTLSNGGERVVLRDNLGNIVDSLTFDTSWYRDEEKADGGWTVEQINPELLCSDVNNWIASSHPQGGTPGKPNANFDDQPDIIPPSISTVFVNSPTEIVAVFDELLDASSLPKGSFTLDNGAIVNHISLTPPSLKRVTLSLQEALVSGKKYTLRVAHITDCSGNPISEKPYTFTFDNEAPIFERFIYKNSMQIDLVFDEALDKETVEIASHYVISEGIGSPSKATLNQADHRRVRLTLEEELSRSKSYTLRFDKLTDLYGNEVRESTKEFVFEDDIDSIWVVSDQLLEIYFKQALDTSASLVTNYFVDRSIGHPSSATLDGGNENLIHLAFDTAFPENRALTINFENIRNEKKDFIQAQNRTFINDTDNPDLDSIRVINEKRVELFFDETLDRTSAEAINHYSANPVLGHPVAAHVQPSGSSVILEFSTGFKQEVVYELSYRSIADLSGNVIRSNRRIPFKFDTLAPRLEEIQLINPTTIILDFSEPISKEVAEDTSHYSVTHGIGNPISAIRSDQFPNRVILNFKNLGNNPINVISILNAEDLSGNAIASPMAGSFSSFTPEIGTFTVLSERIIQVQFTKLLTKTSAEDPSHYSFNNDLKADSIIQNESDASVVRMALNKSLQKGKAYRLDVKNLMDKDSNLVIPQSYDFVYEDHVESIVFLSSNTLRVDFSIPLNEVLATIETNYSLSHGLGHPKSVVLSSEDPRQVILIFSSSFTGSSRYELSIENLKSMYAEVIPKSNHTLYYDVSPPQIESVESSYLNEIEIRFNERLNASTALVLNHYALNEGIGQPYLIRFSDKSEHGVILSFAKNLADSTQYRLTVKRIEDLYGTAMEKEDFSFRFYAPVDPDFRDLVINEVYFDTKSNSGIPNAEYVEIFNRSGKSIELRDFKLTDLTDTAHLSSYLLGDKEIITLSSVSNQPAFSAYGLALGLGNFPSLSNTGETLFLLDRSEEIIDTIAYSTAYYNDETKESGGFSIELINPDKPCFDLSNYGASIDLKGGTPGTQNSIFNDTKDSLAPWITSHQAIGLDQLTVTFSESMDISTFVHENFSLESGIGVKNIDIKNPLGQTITLTLTEAFEAGIIHTLTLSGLADCSGNALPLTELTFAKGAVPEVNTILITEVMASPSPSRGLPETEYLELLNLSSKILSLEGVILSDETTSTTLPPFELNPNERLLLCPISGVSDLSNFGQSLGLNNWPTLNNSGERLSLHNPSNDEITSLNYKESWYGNQAKAQGGYSLEIIDTNYPCLEESNWRASINEKGGTPGEINSINGSNPDLLGPYITLAVAIDQATIQVNFNEKLKTSTISPSDFSTTNGVRFIAAQVDEAGKSVTLTTNVDLQPNFIYSIKGSNLTDCSGNLIRSDGSTYDVIVAAHAEPEDIIINEVLFNPNSGGVRFVELYNNSNKYINLKNWRIAGLTNSRSLTEEILFYPPQQYLVITSDKSILTAQYPKTVENLFIELSSMPSLPSSGGRVIVQDNQVQTVDSYDYDETAHSRLLNETKGVSLERISFDTPSNNPNNWYSASQTEGFATPGYVNSQARIVGPSVGSITIDPATFAPELPGASNFTLLQYQFETPGNVLSIKIVNALGQIVRTLVQNIVVGQEGFFIWDGTLDDKSKARIGYYMVLFEVIDRSGHLSYLKSQVGIGARF